MPLVQPKEAHAEGQEVWALVALQRHTSTDSRDFCQKLFVWLNVCVGNVADDCAWGFVA